MWKYQQIRYAHNVSLLLNAFHFLHRCLLQGFWSTETPYYYYTSLPPQTMPLTRWTWIRRADGENRLRLYKVRFFFLFLCSNLLTSLHSYNDKEVPSFLFGTTRMGCSLLFLRRGPGGQEKDMEGLDLCHPTLRNSITILCHQNDETARISTNSSSPFPTTNTSKRKTGWFFAPPPADIYCHYVAGLVGEGLTSFL